jgi:hypothetical protein
MRRQIIGTASSTIPATRRRPTTSTSTAKRRNRESTSRRADLRRNAQGKPAICNCCPSAGCRRWRRSAHAVLGAPVGPEDRVRRCLSEGLQVRERFVPIQSFQAPTLINFSSRSRGRKETIGSFGPDSGVCAGIRGLRVRGGTLELPKWDKSSAKLQNRRRLNITATNAHDLASTEEPLGRKRSNLSTMKLQTAPTLSFVAAATTSRE